MNYTQNKRINQSDFSRFKSPLLGNREIDKPASKFEHIFKKFNRKNIAQFALTVGNTADLIKKEKSKRKVNRKIDFNINLSFNSTLKTINKSLCSCGRDTHFMNDKKIVDIKESGNARRLKGLKSCGNNSACPVCASKLSAIRGNQLKELMVAGRENGRSYMMVVSTIPHKPLEALDITLNQVLDMSNYIFNSKEWKKFKEKTKCRFVHGGLENMVSFKNGQVDWHPHKNYLLDFDISIDEVINIFGLDTELELRMYVSRLMTKIGQRFLDRKNMQKSLLVPYLQQDKKTRRINVKGGVSASLDFQDDYITKWGLDSEMTAGIYKNGRFDGSINEDGSLKESFHPFVLLDFIDENNQDTSDNFKYQCIKAFQEFVVSSKGKWWFYFGRGSVAYYNDNYGTQLKVKKDKEELLSLEDDGELIYFLEHQEWLDFIPTPRKIGIALSMPTKKEVLEYIFENIENNRIKKNTIRKDYKIKNFKIV